MPNAVGLGCVPRCQWVQWASTLAWKGHQAPSIRLPWSKCFTARRGPQCRPSSSPLASAGCIERAPGDAARSYAPRMAQALLHGDCRKILDALGRGGHLVARSDPAWDALLTQVFGDQAPGPDGAAKLLIAQASSLSSEGDASHPSLGADELAEYGIGVTDVSEYGWFTCINMLVADQLFRFQRAEPDDATRKYWSGSFFSESSVYAYVFRGARMHEWHALRSDAVDEDAPCPMPHDDERGYYYEVLEEAPSQDHFELFAEQLGARWTEEDRRARLERLGDAGYRPGHSGQHLDDLHGLHDLARFASAELAAVGAPTRIYMLNGRAASVCWFLRTSASVVAELRALGQKLELPGPYD